MPRIAFVLALLGSMILVGACRTDSATSRGPGTSAATRAARDTGPAPSAESVHDVMEAKLIHAHALLEAIAQQNFAQIEHQAGALTWLSDRSDWMVHDTEAYAVFSDQFRSVTRQMADHARAQDEEAISLDYVQMVHSCLTCHSYLRREGLVREMPGAVTWANVEKSRSQEVRIGIMRSNR